MQGALIIRSITLSHIAILCWISRDLNIKCNKANSHGLDRELKPDTDGSRLLAGRKIASSFAFERGGTDRWWGGREGRGRGKRATFWTTLRVAAGRSGIKSRTNRKRDAAREVTRVHREDRAADRLYFSWRGGISRRGEGRKRLNASLSGNYDNLCGQNCGLARIHKVKPVSVCAVFRLRSFWTLSLLTGSDVR